MKRITAMKITKKEVIQMKKTILILLAVLVGLFNVLPCYAAPSVNIAVSAQVPNGTPDLTLVIKELSTPNQNPWTGTTVTNMTFGPLTHTLDDGSDAGVWFSKKYYCVIIFTTSFGHRYEVRSTCSGLVSGANSLPAGSFGLTPGYAAADEWSPGNPQGAQPTGSTLGAAGSAVATNKVVYTSETAASNRIIRAFYSLPPYGTGGALPFPGYTPITLSQPSATYSGSVTITIAAI